MRNVIKMALKLLFLQQNQKNCAAVGGLVPQAPFVIHLSCMSLFSTGPESDNFYAKKLRLVQALSL